MADELLKQVEELLRETFDGGLPGEGTQYLDRDSGIVKTLALFTAEQASRPIDGHPTVAGQARHLLFHLRASIDWINGKREKLDWKGSFLPAAMDAAEWAALPARLQQAREELLQLLRDMPHERLVTEGAGMGIIAHLAYHLGSLRQHLPRPAR
jgi:hypothetical protein